ncbi:MAG: hypothetical protein LBC39_07615 [Methanobrevibacter sp.]|nr:hypothetical protein [Candidatus Methanovirga aequatorialis]
MSFKLQDNEYIVVPNGPDYYQNGIWNNSSAPSVDSIIYLGSQDEYGVNRRNIVSYHVSKQDAVTNVDVYASHDDGNLSGKSSSGKDNIIFESRFISNDTIPEIPKWIAIGNIELFNKYQEYNEEDNHINIKNTGDDLNKVSLEKSGNPISMSLFTLITAIFVLLIRRKLIGL